MSLSLLLNSLLVSGLATLLAVSLGCWAALWLLTLEKRWRYGMWGCGVVALALPPFLVTGCWLHWLGYTGAWRGWLPLNIYSLGGAIWILALLTWPITLFLVGGAWHRIEAGQLESDPALRGWALVRWLLLPMAREALAQAAILTLVLSLNNFAVPAILQVKVFPAEVWVNFNTTFDYWTALKLSWLLMLAPFLLLIGFKRSRIAWPRLDRAAPARLLRRQLGPRWFWGSGGISMAIVFFSVVLPLGQLFASAATWRELPGVWAAGRAAFLNSLGYSVLTAILCVSVSLPGWRWRWGWLWWIPFLTPGVLLGIALIFVFNRPWSSAFYQSAGIVILAWTLRYLAICWHGAAHARQTVDPDLTDAARLDGASGWTLFRHIHWPQMAPQLAAAGYITYLLCLWDVETLLLIVPPGGETLSLRVFNLLHYGHNPQVNALCLWLLILGVLPLMFWAIARWTRSMLRRTAIAHWKARSALTQGKWVIPSLLFGVALMGCRPDPSTTAPRHSRLFSGVQIIGARGTGAGQFLKPRSVAVDRQDNLYVADMTGRVQKFSSNGLFLACWQMPQTDLGKPKGMARDRQGNIVIIEPHYSRINHFTPDGKWIEHWGQPGTNSGQLSFPRAVAVNSQGEILVSEYGIVERVQRFAARGEHWLNSFGRPGAGPGELNRAEGLGLDSADRAYVADSCNHRIQIFSPQGQFLRAYGHPGSRAGELSYPYDICLDATGRQYVCEFGNSRLQVFDAHDQSLEVLGGPGAAPGQFNNPWSLALDSAGNLYVADSGNHRVQKLLRRADRSADNPVRFWTATRPGGQDCLPVPARQTGPRSFRLRLRECIGVSP